MLRQLVKLQGNHVSQQVTTWDKQWWQKPNLFTWRNRRLLQCLATAVPGPSNGYSNHNYYQAGHHKVPLSHLDVKEHFGQEISAQKYKHKLKRV